MARAKANGIELEYDVLGDPADPAMLLIMGLGAQLTDWPQEFCEQLAGRGFRVIRFDNRDVGLSSKIETDLDAGAAVLAAFAGQQSEVVAPR